MKRIFILFAFMLAAICFDTAAAQDKKTVAVYVTGNCDGTIKEMVSSRVIAQIVRSREYAAVERTTEFDRALVKEATYTHSGNVDDGQVVRLGRQFGASLVCVVDACQKLNSYALNYNPYEYLFTARLINIETGLVISYSLDAKNCDSGDHWQSNNNICYCGEYDSDRIYRLSNESVISMIDNIAAELLQNVTTTAGKRKLAVYVTESSGVFEGKTVSSRLVQNFSNSGVYAAVDRTSDFKAELSRQYGGKVDDSQITKLGRQFGVNLVCVARVLGNGYTYARMINAETGIILATAESYNWRLESVDAITGELLSQTVECVRKDGKITSPLMKCCEGLTVVDGVCRDLNSSSEWAIELKFEDVKSFSEGLAAVQQNSKWGFIDKTGKTVIQPQFNRVESFREDLAAVQQGSKWGFIDKTGKMVIQPQFDATAGFSEGLALIENQGKIGVIDKTGKVAFWFKKEIENFGVYFSEGLLAASVSQKNVLSKRYRESNKLRVWENEYYADEDCLRRKYRDFTAETVERWGFLNKNGEWVIEPKFYDVSHLGFNEGVIMVTIPLPYRVAGKISGNDYYSYAINKNGATVCRIYDSGSGVNTARRNYTGAFSEGLMVVRSDKILADWGYKDKTGQWAIQPQFDEVRNFNEGLAIAKQNDKWGFIDKTGKWVIQPQFGSSIMSFYDGLAGVKKDDKWGFIDKTGKWVILPVFDEIWSFSEGLAGVKQNGKWGFIALPGK
jgi:hypothetical protein